MLINARFGDFSRSKLYISLIRQVVRISYNFSSIFNTTKKTVILFVSRRLILISHIGCPISTLTTALALVATRLGFLDAGDSRRVCCKKKYEWTHPQAEMLQFPNSVTVIQVIQVSMYRTWNVRGRKREDQKTRPRLESRITGVTTATVVRERPALPSPIPT